MSDAERHVERDDEVAGESLTPAIRRGFGAQVLGETFRRAGARLGALWVVALAVAAVAAPFVASSHPVLMRVAEVPGDVVAAGALAPGWSSPLVRHLTPADVTLLVGFVAGVALIVWRGARFGWRIWLWVLIVGVTTFVTVWGALPEALRSYRQSGLAEAVEPWCAGAGRYAVLAGVVTIGAGLLLIALGREKGTGVAARVGFFIFYVVITGVLVLVPIQPPAAVVYSQYREAEAAGEIEFALYTLIPFSPTDYQRDQADPRLKPPGGRHWLGTEVNGADLLSRMIHASRIALSIGLISTGIALVIGVLVGSLMGYFSGMVDMIGMRLVEIVEAIPTLFLLIIFVTFLGRNLYLMMAIIGVTSWTGYCRFIRAEYLKLRQQDFIQAARAAGLPLWSILFKHMLPNGVAPVLVAATFGVASAILAETTLSFLGLGLVDEPSWGEMLNQVLAVGGTFNWWMATFPGLAIFLTVFSYNLIGEALRDAIDPHRRVAG